MEVESQVLQLISSRSEKCSNCRSGGSSLWGPKHSLGARVEAALDVARGMAALECTTPPLVHRDLKPSNVFIGSPPPPPSPPHKTRRRPPSSPLSWGAPIFCCTSDGVLRIEQAGIHRLRHLRFSVQRFLVCLGSSMSSTYDIIRWPPTV